MGLSMRKGFQKQMQKPTDCRGFELTLLCRLLLAQEKTGAHAAPQAGYEPKPGLSSLKHGASTR